MSPRTWRRSIGATSLILTSAVLAVNTAGAKRVWDGWRGWHEFGRGLGQGEPLQPSEPDRLSLPPLTPTRVVHRPDTPGGPSDTCRPRLSGLSRRAASSRRFVERRREDGSIADVVA